MTTIVCGHCGTPCTDRRGTNPRCQPCGIWLFGCELTGQWVGAAEREARIRRAHTDAIIEQTRQVATASIDEFRTLLPDGWHAQVNQIIVGACYTVDIHPPTGPVDVHAYLTPPHDGHSWYVRVFNRTRGLDFPLYTDGGVHAATFPTVPDALAAAISVVRIETSTAR
jgi:hypothetical protein